MEIEMEKKRNKKRVTTEKEEQHGDSDSDRSSLKKLKAAEQEQPEEIPGSSGVPTEEEVDEFFAILRRMKVAVKYFDDKGKGRKEWREALEQADVAVDDGLTVAGEVAAKTDSKSPEVIVNERFDLNTVAPEAAEYGGA